MKIALINGSPKKKHSASAALLQMLKNQLPEEYVIIPYHFYRPKISFEDWERIKEAEVLVLAFPLYVDGIPSQVLSCLEQIEGYSRESTYKENMVYLLINCGFYEGRQNALALEMLKNWCAKARLKWGMGVGIGGGGMISAFANMPDEKGPKKNVGKAVRELAEHIKAKESGPDHFVDPNLPRFAYKMVVEMYWRQLGKRHGLKSKDLSRRL